MLRYHKNSFLKKNRVHLKAHSLRKEADRMKRFLCVASAFLFSSTVFASNELEINGLPLTLVLNDNNIAKVSSCSDFISLRKSGETVKNILDISEPDYDQAKAALTDCYINAYAIQNGLVKKDAPAPSLSDLLKHFPASEKLIVSDNEKEEVQKNSMVKAYGIPHRTL